MGVLMADRLCVSADWHPTSPPSTLGSSRHLSMSEASVRRV